MLDESMDSLYFDTAPDQQCLNFVQIGAIKTRVARREEEETGYSPPGCAINPPMPNLLTVDPILLTAIVTPLSGHVFRRTSAGPAPTRGSGREHRHDQALLGLHNYVIYRS